MTTDPETPDNDDSTLKDFEETGAETLERKQRWGDHSAGGATMMPGGDPAGAKAASEEKAEPE